MMNWYIIIIDTIFNCIQYSIDIYDSICFKKIGTCAYKPILLIIYPTQKNAYRFLWKRASMLVKSVFLKRNRVYNIEYNIYYRHWRSPLMPASSAERWWTERRRLRGYCCGKDCLWRNDPPGSSWTLWTYSPESWMFLKVLDSKNK